MANILEAVQAWLLSSYGVRVPHDWLAACVEWIQQENGGQVMSAPQLQPMVFEQWLMSDLKELEAACLPTDLPLQLFTQIGGPLALQVESMVDVGFPLYGQLQKVKGTTNVNTEVSADKPLQPAWEPKPSRMMLLKMTDGQTEVQGMEYRPIPALTSNLQPGFKMVVHGQVTCRHGVLMLAADNVQILGGEVDSLVEANTPVAVLQQAMEYNTTNNGKHAKREFSGRFVNRQDYKQGQSGLKHKVQTTTHTEQKPTFCKTNPGTSHVGGQSRYSGAIKKEPLTLQNTMDDEWEEDLDYGGILNSLEEPMEEEMDHVLATSHLAGHSGPSAISTAAQRDSGFAGSAAFSSSESSAWQSALTSTSSTSVKPNSSNVKSLPSERAGFGSSCLLQNEQRVQSHETKTEGRDGDRSVWAQTLSTQNREEVTEDNMWEDDDDFDLAQAEGDWMSPVIPAQDHFSLEQYGSGTTDFSTAGHHAGSVSSVKAGVSGVSNFQHPQGSFGNLSKPKAVQNFDSSRGSAEIQPTSKPSHLPQNSSKNCFSVTVQNPSSSSSREDTKPPPSKQRKLTSMLSRTRKEIKQEANSTFSPPEIIDITSQDSCSFESDGDSMHIQEESGGTKQENYATLGGSSLSVKQGETRKDIVKQENNATLGTSSFSLEEVGSTKEENIPRLDGGSFSLEREADTAKQESRDPCSASSSSVVSHTTGKECQDVGMLDRSDGDCLLQSDITAQSGHIPKAVIAPFTSQGNEMPSASSPQPLRDVQTWLQSSSDGENTFTIKGHITTLTDRLRSGRGDEWSLSCRITDGATTMEVALADSVLSHLIGFSAEESITLRQQARQDPKVKDYLTDNLHKCQKKLAEFSGLMDVKAWAGNSKPSIVNMIQLGKKDR